MHFTGAELVVEDPFLNLTQLTLRTPCGRTRVPAEVPVSAPPTMRGQEKPAGFAALLLVCLEASHGFFFSFFWQN